MTDPILSRTQRNAIFEMIRQQSLDPADFQWSEEEGDHEGPIEKLSHLPTNGVIRFSRFQQGGWWVKWWPSKGLGERYDAAKQWNQLLGYTMDWLLAVHADHQAPDLWAEIAKEKTISDAAERPEYQKQFSAAELAQLEKTLPDIENFITTTQPLDAVAKQEVHKRFTYLLDAAKKGARKIDWLNIFVGQMVGMVTAGLLDPRLYSTVMAHAATALNAVFQFGLKLLG